MATTNGLINSLTEAESALVRETQPARIAGLDEDALVELHQRVRRARNKYVKLYRREGSARVSDLGGRGFARPKNRRNAGKAEVFEDALSRVSRQLATAARRSARDLRAERLTAARGPAGGAAPARKAAPRAARKASTTKAAGPTRDRDARPRTPATTKRVASSRAAGARRQARRDSR